MGFALTDVHKNYRRRGSSVAALDGVSLSIAAGEFVAVVGPSGCGKSTLLQIVGGLLAPSSGSVSFRGDDLYARRSADDRAAVRRANMGFVFQTFNLVPYLSAMENVQLPMAITGLTEAVQSERASALLTRMGLGDRLDHRPGELSIGQQQRVALARTLANEPTVILADEPTGNLDPETGSAILDMLASIHSEGRTVVMVTHDPQAARRAKRTLRLDRGRIMSDERVG
ncbi:MAG: ABC transporter ATP-binding protein [Planctomycetes bacterium]|nr:ABC transporter ATP-binding protein [Planctomycetota bacterium]